MHGVVPIEPAERPRAILAVDTFILALEGTGSANLFPGSIFYFLGAFFSNQFLFCIFRKVSMREAPHAVFLNPFR